MNHGPNREQVRHASFPDPAEVYELIRSLALGGQGTKSVLPE